MASKSTARFFIQKIVDFVFIYYIYNVTTAGIMKAKQEETMKVLGYIFVALLLVAAGFLACYFGLGEKIKELFELAKNCIA